MRKVSAANGEELWSISRNLLELDSVQATSRNSGLKDRAIELIDLLRSAMWPQIFGYEKGREPGPVVVMDRLERAACLLEEIIELVDPEKDAGEAALSYIRSLPEIKEMLLTDVEAAYEGDPAARNASEIMMAYPAFEAISIYRLAHRLFEMGIPLLPRMMTERAHRITGIDIHPGAVIGRYFFIDHGTGVVVGETTTIGEHVKLYQGVTLGAKSFPLDENGNPVKGLKRHPDIGNNVVIYAGATILGGDTRIGDDCVIGGNVWLTHSVEAGRQVLAAQERS